MANSVGLRFAGTENFTELILQIDTICAYCGESRNYVMDAKTRPGPIPASEFTRNFGHYRVQAHRGAVAVSSHGRIAGYFVAPDEYEEYVKSRSRRRSFAIEELDEETVDAIAKTRMNRRHAHLNRLLKNK